MKRRKTSLPVLYSPFLPFLLAIIFGILLDNYFQVELWRWKRLIGASLIFFVVARLLFFIFFKLISRKYSLLFFRGGGKHRFLEWALAVFLSGNIGLWTAALGLGGLRHDYFYNYYAANEIGFFLPQKDASTIVELKLLKTPVLREYPENNMAFFTSNCSTSFVAEIERLKDAGEWKVFSGRVAVRVSGDATDLKIGDRIRVAGTIGHPSKPNNPGERDQIFYYRSQRILTILRVNSVSKIEVLAPSEESIKQRILSFLEKLRLRAASVLSESLSKQNAAVASGMTLGLRNEVDNETYDSFRRSGAAHLLAISGLHVMLVVGALALFLRAFGVPEPVIGAASIFFVLFYMGLTDMRTPVIRASILISMMSLGIIFKADDFFLDLLAMAGIVILMWNPCELFQPGAQLSFIATGSFLWSSSITLDEEGKANIKRWEAIKDRRREKERRMSEKYWKQIKNNTYNKTISLVILPRWRAFSRYYWGKFKSITKSGAIIWAVGAPLVLFLTNLFTPIAIVVNPIIWIPATASLIFAFQLEFLGVLTSFLGKEGIIASLLSLWGILTEKSFDVFLWILDYMSSREWGAFYLPSPPQWALLLFYCPLFFWTVFPHLRPSRRNLGIFVGTWVFLLVSFAGVHQCIERRHDSLAVDVLSIGHGGATLGFFSDGRTFLYDCGSMDNPERVADIVAKSLWLSGRTKIDVVILSHADIDHYGALVALLDRVKVQTVCISPWMFHKKNRSLALLQNSLKEHGISTAIVSEGDSLGSLGFPELLILHPPKIIAEERERGGNEDSIVLKIRYLDRSLLFPGDLDCKDADFLNHPSEKFDFVLAPHHGGQSTNEERFYEWANSEWIGISGGALLRNKNKEIELKEKGYRIAHTFDDGTIQIRIARGEDKTDKNDRGAFTITTFKTGRNSTDETW